MDAIRLTRREKRCKILNKFKFREYRELKNGNFNYLCTNKFCNASITVNYNNQIVDQSKSTVSYLRLAAYDWTQRLVATTDLYLNCERGFQCAIDACVSKIVVAACDYSDPIAVLSMSRMRISINSL